jgi:LAS superfamily LD-carboxypeptidase LdcB
MKQLTERQKLCYGFANRYLTELVLPEQTITLHKNAVQPLSDLMTALKNDGLPIKVISHWRSFDHQLAIWQKKWSGERPLLDQDSNPLEVDHLTDQQKLEALCFWSALPGTSRHHWGTDFDIFLSEPIAQGHRVELVQNEFGKNGVCESLDYWLDNNLGNFDFYRPYSEYRGGVCPEPWHISYRPEANPLLNEIRATEVALLVRQCNLPGGETLLNELQDYLQNYVFNVS